MMSAQISFDEFVRTLPLKGDNLSQNNLAGHPERIVSACRDEFDCIAGLVEVMSWTGALHGEAIGDAYFRGISEIGDQVRERLRIISDLLLYVKEEAP